MSIFRAKLSTLCQFVHIPRECVNTSLYIARATRTRANTYSRALWSLERHQPYLLILYSFKIIFFCIYRKIAVNLQRKYVIINHFKILTL